MQRKTVVRHRQTVNGAARKGNRLTGRFPLRAQDGLSDDGQASDKGRRTVGGISPELRSSLALASRVRACVGTDAPRVRLPDLRRALSGAVPVKEGCSAETRAIARSARLRRAVPPLFRRGVAL
jgi:hypothetical protein